MTQRSKITQLPSTTSTKKKKIRKKKKKKRKEKKKDEKKRKINKKANDQKVNYPKGERAKQTTYMAEKKNNNIVANGGPLLCHTIKAISRRIFSNKEQCQLLIKDYNCFKTASTD